VKLATHEVAQDLDNEDFEVFSFSRFSLIADNILTSKNVILQVFQLMVSVKTKDGDQHVWEVSRRFRDCYDLHDQVNFYSSDPLRDFISFFL
jgi:hypothetical protein